MGEGRWRGRRSGWRGGSLVGRRCDHSENVGVVVSGRFGTWLGADVARKAYHSVCFFEKFIAGVGALTRIGTAMGVVLAEQLVKEGR